MAGERLELTELDVLSGKVSAIVHATEDIDRVLQALAQLFPERSLPSKAETRRFHGHHGNEIRMVEVSFRGASARSLLEYLWKSLSSFDRASILDALDKHLESNGVLHLRLDKEEVFRGVLKMKEQDPIKIQLSFERGIKSDFEPNEEVKRLLKSLENSSGNPTDHS